MRNCEFGITPKAIERGASPSFLTRAVDIILKIRFFNF
jgi:hypothetical protein